MFISFIIVACIQCIYMQTTTKNTMNVIPSPKWAYMSLQIYFIHSGQKIVKKRTNNTAYLSWFAISH